MPKTKRRRPNVFRIDPTRTVTIRKRFVAEMRRRFAKIRGEIVRLIAIDDAFGIRRRITTNKAGDDWRFATSSEQVKAFQEWLEELYGEHLSIQQLMKKFAEDGYKRGIGRAFNDVEKPYGNGKMVYDNLTGDFYTPNRDQFLRSAFGSHIGVERVNQLASRSFGDLKNVTTDMSTRMSRTLLEGLVDGSHPNDIAKDLSKDIDISLSRAETIARTEIIRAHAEGQLDAMERMGVSEVGVQVEWVTAGDDAVCPRCEAMEGVVMEIEKAHNMLPMHPNCVLGDSQLICRDALALMRVKYSGEVVECITTKGRRFTITRNHMLLSEFGFIPAYFLYEGLNVIDAALLDPELSAPHDDRHIPSISDIFVSIVESGSVFSVRMKPTAENFHGDGASCNSDVDIIRPNGKLRNHGHSSVFNDEITFKITETPDSASNLFTPSSATQLIERVLLSADRSMGRCRESLAVLLGSLLHASKHTLATVTGSDSMGSEHTVYVSSSEPEFLRQSIDAHPFLKQLKYLLSWHGNGCSFQINEVPSFEELKLKLLVCKSEFFGDASTSGAGVVHFDCINYVKHDKLLDTYMYDVTGHRSFYSLNGIVSSNCRCAFLPAGEVLQPRTIAEAAIEGLALADVENIFCPTGEGGGVDPSCGGDGGGSVKVAELTPEEAALPPPMRAVVSASRILAALRSVGEAVGLVRSRTAPPEISVTPKATEHIKTMFGGTGSVDSIAKMVGATDGASVVISEPITHSTGQKFIRAEIDHPDYGAVRWVFDDHIENVTFTAKETGKGLGTKVFAQQVAEAAAKGLKYIGTNAIRTKHANGYYTWARLGYDGKVPMGQHGGKKVSELMKTKEGRDWWKEHGQSTTMTFDLTEGSQSRRIFDAYLQERSKRAGAGGTTANYDSGGRGYFGLDLGLDGRVMTLEDVENVFCPTGEGGGVDPTCSPPNGGGLPASKMPAEPSFVSSNATAVKANKAAIQSMKDLASSGALETLKAHEGTPSPKVQQFKKDLVAALEQHKADEEPLRVSLVDSEDDYTGGAIIVEDDPVELPTNLTGAKILKENMGGGSQTPPKLIEKDGQKLVMKVSKNAVTLDHIKSEVDADNAYRAAGFAVPVSSMSTYGGKDVKIAEFLEGAKELNEWENNASYEEIAAVYADIAKGMAADALFANWDAVGTGKNNIMVKENPFGPPSVFRIDNGGSFKYRAMGELKKDWNYKVTLKSLQDPSKNPNADVYANVTDEELHGQIQSLLDKKLDIIKAVKDPDTRDILEQRFNHMESQMAALAPAPPAPKPSSLFPDGDSITDLLKGKGDKAHTKLYMKKVAALNPNGIENGTIKIPISFYTPAKGSKEAAVAKLHETVKWLEGKVPAGTKVEAVEKYLTAKTLGITKTFGNDGDKFTSTQATTAAQEHATIPDKLQKYLPSPVKGVVTLTNTPDPPKDEAWKAKLSYDEKNAVSSWKGSAKSIRVAISSGRMTPTAEAFMSVLEKAPIHEGVVYRGISGKYAEDIAKHIEAAGIGGLWSDAAPHCMSTNIATAKSFANGKVLLRIVTKTGRTIWKEDGYSGEKEVTGMPGTLYKIMAIDKDVKDSKASGYAGKLKHMITLMEVGKK